MVVGTFLNTISWYGTNLERSMLLLISLLVVVLVLLLFSDVDTIMSS